MPRRARRPAIPIDVNGNEHLVTARYLTHADLVSLGAFSGARGKKVYWRSDADRDTGWAELKEVHVLEAEPGLHVVVDTAERDNGLFRNTTPALKRHVARARFS